MTETLNFFVSFWLALLATVASLVLCIRKIPALTTQKTRAFWGGLCLVGVSLIVSMLGILFWYRSGALWLILGTAALMFVTGLYDDRKEFAPALKFLLHTIVAVIYLAAGGKRILFAGVPELVNYALSFIWIVGITNAINHLDIKDGLAGGVAFIITGVLAFIAYSTANSAMIWVLGGLLGGLAAFIIFNLHPAKVYMGNAGSHCLGFLLATLAMYVDYNRAHFLVAFAVPLLIFLVPIVDTSILIVSRLSKGVSVAHKTDDHFFFSLEKKFGITRSLMLFWGASLLSGIIAYVIFAVSFYRR